MAGMIRRFPHSPPRVVPLAGAYVASTIAGYRERDLFSHVESYCMFAGYPRSGHSLVGSLLDAHPDMVIAHELNALGFIRARFRRAQLYSLILNNSRMIAALGRQETGYSYEVPNQWQGRFRTIRVIGDKNAMGATLRLGRRPYLLDRLQRVVRDPVRFVHIVRNPYDNISTIARRDDLTLEQATAFYLNLSTTALSITRRVGQDHVMVVRHESFVADAKAALKELCSFLGVTSPDDYLDACASIVYESPHMSRHDSPWTPDSIRSLEREMKRFPFFEGYSWDT